MIRIKGSSISGGSLAVPFGTGSARRILRQDRRFLTSMLPAAVVTFGLFVTMTQLIRVDEVELAPVVHRPLLTITPQHKESEPNLIDRVPAPDVDLELPPMPPVTKTGPTVEGLPLPVIDQRPVRMQDSKKKPSGRSAGPSSCQKSGRECLSSRTIMSIRWNSSCSDVESMRSHVYQH